MKALLSLAVDVRSHRSRREVFADQLLLSSARLDRRAAVAFGQNMDEVTEMEKCS